MPTILDVQKENQNLIRLAVKCKLITADQEQKVLFQLIDLYQNNPGYSVVKIFKEEKMLTQKQINFLFNIKVHLKIKMLDKRFGELGVSNRFISSKSVENALDHQNECFTKTQQTKKIGEILIENNEITQANKTAILLTQDRIEDEFLAQAMNDLATSEMEKITLNMRFGAIAVKKGMISIAQLNQALKTQKNELKLGQEKRYLGDIFQEFFEISKKDVIYILKIQKEFEKSRLALEKSLSRYTSGITTNKRLNELFEYCISKNKMEAYVQRKKDSFEKININGFHNWLKLNGINFGICNYKLIEVFLSDSDIDSKIKIAQGVPPTQSRDAIIEFSFDTDFYRNREDTQNEQLPFVKKGEILAKIIPHELGKTGKDVFGHSIAPSNPKIFSLVCGEGVVRKDLTFVADTDGNPILYKKRSLFVTPVVLSHPSKMFTGHIKTDTMKTYDSSNLKIEGNINYGGVVTCHRLLITGNVFGKVTATGDIEVKGCIGKEDKAKATSKYPTQLHADGKIIVSKTIANAKIFTSKGFTAPKSDARSCEIYALHDILLKNVYSSPEHPSILQIGKRFHLKVDAINCAIDEQTADLRKLQRQDELDELTFKFQNKVKAQNDYMEKQNILTYLLKICDNVDLKHIEDIEQKIQMFEPLPEKDLNSDHHLPFPNDDDSLEYMDKILAQIKETGPEDQRNYVNEMRIEITRMYRAAVSATERYTNEYKAKSNFIMEKIDKIRPEIIKKKQEIEELLTKKDYLLFQEEKFPLTVEPVIKVKNIIEKSTIIKGKKASMIVEQSIYGVKMKESKNSSTNEYQILIEGYYD